MSVRNHTTINITSTSAKRLAGYCGKRLHRSAVLSEIVDKFLDEQEKIDGKKY